MDHSDRYRPYQDKPPSWLLRASRWSIDHDRIDLFSFCVEEALLRQREREIPINTLRNLNRLRIDAPWPYIPWIGLAGEVMRKIRRPSEGKHHVYLVLLRGHPRCQENRGYGLYVGETVHTPEKRFHHHRKGHYPSKHVKRYGDRLMTIFFQHLNPLGRNEAQNFLEQHIRDSLESAGVPVFGGEYKMDYRKLSKPTSNV